MSDQPEQSAPAPADPAIEADDAALRATRWKQLGIGFGIGSAGLVAALLYANQKKPRAK